MTYFHGKAVKDPTSRKARDVKFAFDHVFSPMSTNIEVYEQTTKSILTSLLDGYNCSGIILSLYLFFAFCSVVCMMILVPGSLL